MNATDGRPTIGHHPRASRLAPVPRQTVSQEEILTALEDARVTRAQITRMIGWSPLLPEDAIVSLRSAQMVADAIVEGLVNALQAIQRD